METIKKLGIDKIMHHHITCGSIDLITTTQKVNNQVQVATRQWLTIPNATKEKAKVLRVIAKALHADIKVTLS